MSCDLERNCPICSQYDNEILFKQEFADIKGVTFLKKYEVVKCNNCGFIYADNIPPQEEFDSYYKNFSKYEFKVHELTPDEIDRFEYSLEFINECLKQNNTEIKELNMVDVGCATGDFLRFLKQKGYDKINAIDPSSLCVGFLNSIDITSEQATINELNIDKKYEFIRLNAVLEHIVDLNNSIEQLKRILKERGYLYLSMPNIEGFKELENCPFQEFSVEHINYFSRLSLSNLMKKHGFSLVDYRSNSNKLYSEMEAVFIYDQEDIKDYQYKVEEQYENIRSVNEYIELNYKLENEVNKRIKNLNRNGDPIIVWGVGTHTLRQLAKGELGRCNIKLFVDSNIHYQGSKYNDIDVISPKEIYKYDYKILISSYYGQESINSYIKNVLKLNNDVIRLYDF